MLATLVGLFGAAALLLAALGLYGVMAHVANQRTLEIGIRLAMGAQPASVVSLLLGQGLRLLGTGAAIGLACALVGTRYIEAQLFGVTSTDPVTFVSGSVVIAIAGLTASVIPALRAMRVDPIIALRGREERHFSTSARNHSSRSTELANGFECHLVDGADSVSAEAREPHRNRTGDRSCHKHALGERAHSGDARWGRLVRDSGGAELRGVGPQRSGTVASIRFGSSRQTLLWRRFDSHTDPWPTRMASPPGP